jgi:reticulon-4-interacting protein 1, mitochondrial
MYSSVDFFISCLLAMRAIVYNYGRPKLVERPIPTIDEKSVLVRIKAAGVNPVDAKYVMGDKFPDWPICQRFVKWRTQSSIPGFDFSGIIEGVPKSCPFQIGDQVYGTVPPFTGTFCQYQAVPLDQICLMPKNLSFAEAAASPLTGLTVHQSFVAHQVNSTSRLLVIGASGGTGHFAVPYAKKVLHVQSVVAICGKANVEWVKSLGADLVLDYRDPQWQSQLIQDVRTHGPFSHVLDTVASVAAVDQGTSYPELLHSKVDEKPLLVGKYLTLGGPTTAWLTAGIKRAFGWDLFPNDYELFWVRFPNSSHELQALKDATETVGVKIKVSHEYPFSEEGVRQAFEQLMSRRTVGKVVINIDQEKE